MGTRLSELCVSVKLIQQFQAILKFFPIPIASVRDPAKMIPKEQAILDLILPFNLRHPEALPIINLSIFDLLHLGH